MKDLVAELNPDQRDVVLETGHCLVISTAGSGKTKTLATKAASLLMQGQRVVAVTFTREAALELRGRIVDYAGPGCKPRLLVGTFHSVDMLMAFPKSKNPAFGREILADIKSPFTEPWKIVPEGVRRSYVIRAAQDAGLAIKLDEATKIIEDVKSAKSFVGLDDNMKTMCETYMGLMSQANYIDFQDIILKTNAALSDKTLSTLPVDHLLIDEYQDTDKHQYEWARHHGRAGVAITAVGDDDQSIYGFRNALGYDGMQQFVREFNARRILLGTNYRCRSEILGAAGQLIGKNTERIPKQLFANKGQGGVVSWELFENKVAEANAVGEDAFAATSEGASFAVISRTNQELVDVERALIERGIPFRKSEGKSIFDRPEVQIFSAALRTILKPTANDVDSCLAWAGLSTADCAEIRRVFGTSILMGSKKDFDGSKLSEAGIQIWRSFAKNHGEWVKLNQQKLYALLNTVVLQWLADHLEKPHNIEILNIAASMYEVKTGTLEDRLAEMKSAEANLTKDTVDGNPVHLVTAHSSKGLEFDRVWIIGMSEGVFPSLKSALEEERRLMFVAITRAREILMTSSVKDKKTSIFIAEAGLAT